MSEYKNLFGSEILSNKSSKVSTDQLKDKIIALYFSAHWCPPCRAFTPQLVQIYKTLQEKGKPFDIIFVSSDQDQHSFDEYFATHPWKAVPFDREDIRQSLAEKFGVRGIPQLIVLDANSGKIISKDGRNEVVKMKEGVFDHWQQHK